MTILTNARRRSIIAALSLLFVAALSADQGPPPAAPQTGAPGQSGPPGGGRGGRGGGLPGVTPEQTQALADMTALLADLNAAVTSARAELAKATFADVKSVVAMKAAVEKVRVAEVALASRRAVEFAKLQASPNKLNADQINALIAAGGNPAAGGRGGAGRGGVPGALPAGGIGRGGR